MRILVTGGAGFIASHIADRYILEGHEVAVVDDLTTGKKANINSQARFYQMSIRSPEIERVFAEFEPEICNHHAAHIDLRRSVIDPAYDADINVLGTLNLLQNAVRYRTRKFIFASTGGAIYGDPRELPVTEKAIPEPLSPYGIHKLTAEHYFRIYRYLHGIDYTVLRYPNVYGPRQDPKGEAGVVAIFSKQLLSGITPVIFGDGTKTRDYVYVSDVVEANVLSLDKGSDETMNLGWGVEVSDQVVFDAVAEALGSRSIPGYGEIRPGEVVRISLNSLKAQRVLGWKPVIVFEEGIKMSVQFYKHWVS
jgi:UDP-glucose 4-epimerase